MWFGDFLHSKLADYFAHTRRVVVATKPNFTRWMRKGFWAVADQSLFASSNFVLSVLLARWLTPQGFGAFTIVYTTFSLLGIFYTALLSEPMLVFGPGKHRNRLRQYVGVLVYGHLAFVVPGSLLFLLASVGFGASGSLMLSSALLSIALAGPLILFQWLMRRACYVRSEPNMAAMGGAMYMVVMLAGAYVFYQRGWLTAAAVFGLMGLGSSIAGIWLAVRFRLSLSQLSASELLRETFKDHWSYGRWAAATGVLFWVPGSIYYLLLPAWGGLESSAALKALMNTILPIWHVQASLSILLVPPLVRARGRADFDHLMRLALILFMSGGALYGVFLILLGGPLVTWLYKGQYSEYIDLFWLLALLPLVTGVEAVLSGVLRALERPDRVLWAYLLSTVVALTVGLGAMLTMGIVGAAVGLLLSSITAAAVMVWFLTVRKTSVR
jgi:O-antigen/teichoic acid export membrane protein